ncbi:MAG: glycosyltransferase, partial [Anaerolineales bacterium]
QAPNRKIVSWWLDDPILYFHDYPQVRAQLEHLHTLFVFDRGRFKELNGFGARQVAYLPCAFDPTIYRPKQVSIEEMNRYQCDVGLVASYYPKRGELVKHMQGLDVAIWGVGWKDKPEIKAFPQGVLRGKSLEGPDIATAYNVMRISPNLHHSQTILGGLNMRAFEIPAAGGFQLMDEVPGAEELFEPGSELVMYHSTAHFRELVDYYLSHPSERDAIARRGYERAIRQHTYKHRLQVMLETVENSQ